MAYLEDEGLNSILFGSIPKHKYLCYLLGTISIHEKNAANISNKAYQCQIFKCRCLIFSVPEVIASPVLGAVQNIHIITSREYYSSEKLNTHLDKLNIKVQEPAQVTNTVYEACLRYTILARLAPSWNQVEKYLVHGRDFLTTSAPLNAVKLDLVINETDMHMVLWPLKLRLPQVCAEDIQSSCHSPLSWNVVSNSLTVHVLPSLNEANVLMVTNCIPHNSLFKSYRELRRHWKNSYGYRLPESEEGMVYLTVKFGRWFSESLTYPIACVRARRPIFLRQHNPQKVLLDLLADMNIKIPYICGFPFGIETTIFYAIPKINSLTQVTFPCNLTEKKEEVKRGEVIKENEEPVTEHNEAASQTLPSNMDTQPEPQSHGVSPPPFCPQLSQLRPVPRPPIYVPMFTTKYPSPLAFSQVRPMFGGAPVKPIFGLARPPLSTSSFQLNQPLSNNSRLKPSTPITIFSPNTPNPFNQRKGEKTLLQIPESAGRKSRARPQVQQGVDVKALAHIQDGLAKVNTTTLIAYLRSEGVPCKVKDKKRDLVLKVLSHLNLPLPSTLSSTTDNE